MNKRLKFNDGTRNSITSKWAKKNLSYLSICALKQRVVFILAKESHKEKHFFTFKAFGSVSLLGYAIKIWISQVQIVSNIQQCLLDLDS